MGTTTTTTTGTTTTLTSTNTAVLYRSIASKGSPKLGALPEAASAGAGSTARTTTQSGTQTALPSGGGREAATVGSLSSSDSSILAFAEPTAIPSPSPDSPPSETSSPSSPSLAPSPQNSPAGIATSTGGVPSGPSSPTTQSLQPSFPSSSSSFSRAGSSGPPGTTPGQGTEVGIFGATPTASRAAGSSGSLPTSSSSSQPSPTEAVPAPDRGFLHNKAAIAGTFTTLGIVILCILVAFFIVRRKRRVQWHQVEDSDSVRSFAYGAESPVDYYSVPIASEPWRQRPLSQPDSMRSLSSSIPHTHRSILRELGMENSYATPSGGDFLQVPSSSTGLRREARGSYESTKTIDSFFGAT